MTAFYAWAHKGETVVIVGQVDDRWYHDSHRMPPDPFADTVAGWFASATEAQQAAREASAAPLDMFRPVPPDQDPFDEALVHRPA